MASSETVTTTALPSTIVFRDDPKYEEPRVGRVFSGRRPDRYAYAVVEANCVEDVVKAVKLAREKGLRVSVRSGGYSWAAWSVRDHAVLIDLGNLKRLELDESTNIAIASPSTTGRVMNTF
jgi:FAD/FMN-containing dehydrogenase